MSAPAPVTEAHRQAAFSIFELAMKWSQHGAPFREPCAQFIADSEAKACAELLQQVANLTHSNDSHRETAETWRAAAIERDQLRAEVERLKAASDKEDSMATTTIDQRDRAEDAADKLASAILGEPIDWPDHDAKWSEALEEAECVHDLKASLSEMIAQSRVDSSVAGIAICNEMEALARAERAEAEVDQLTDGLRDSEAALALNALRAERAEAELATCRESLHLADGTANLALVHRDAAEAELATERARMADLVADLNDACITLESAKNDCDDYAMQNTAFKLLAVSNVLLQYIPNAAMKEETK